MIGWRIVQKTQSSEWSSVAIVAGAFALSLAICALLLYVQGKDGSNGIFLLLSGGFGRLYSYGETLLKAIPIFLCSLGVALCFRLQIWNIGAEGQYVVGTLGGCWFALNFPELSAWLMIPGMLTCAMLAGGLWAAIAALLRQKWGMNEIISTLMLNYIGIEILKHLIYGSWRDPAGMNFPVSPYFAESAIIGQVWDSAFWSGLGVSESTVSMFDQLFGRAHWGIVSCLVAGVLCSLFLRKTLTGYEITVAGSNAKAARFAGIPYSALVVLVMFTCGALAGLAGIQEASATLNRLEPHIVVGYGYTAVVVAWLAKLHTMRIAFFAFLLAGLRVGVENLQLELQISSSFASTLEGIILITVLAGQFFNDYTLKRKTGKNLPAA